MIGGPTTYQSNRRPSRRPPTIPPADRRPSRRPSRAEPSFAQANRTGLAGLTGLLIDRRSNLKSNENTMCFNTFYGKTVKTQCVSILSAEKL